MTFRGRRPNVRDTNQEKLSTGCGQPLGTTLWNCAIGDGRIDKRCTRLIHKVGPNPVDIQWTTRWTDGENVVRPAYCGHAAGLPGALCTPRPRPRTSRDQRRLELSPASTAPTKTTFLSLIEKQNHHQAVDRMTQGPGGDPGLA